MSGHFRVLAALPQGKDQPIPIMQQVLWILEMEMKPRFLGRPALPFPSHHPGSYCTPTRIFTARYAINVTCYLTLKLLPSLNVILC